MRRAGRRRTLVVLAALVAAVLLAGCGLISGLRDTRDALEEAGFTDPSVHVSTSGDHDSVRVRVTHAILSTDATPVRDSAARVVWVTFPWRFDSLFVELRGVDPSPGIPFRYADLADHFGPRPAGLDRHTYHHEVRRIVVLAVIGVGAAGLVFVAAVVLVIVLVVRHNRRRRALASAWQPQWGQPQWGQPQWGQPQWGQPPPPPGAWAPPRDPPKTN